MIRGVHAMFYTADADGTRAFLRDRLGLAATDIGHGWLLFEVADAELGCHPAGDGGATAGTHDVSFTCDDVERTVTELRARGVEFSDDISDRGYGRVIHFAMPGGVKVELFQPRYARRGDELRDKVRAFFEGYGVALSRGDLKAISASWVLPALVISDGGAVAIGDRQQIEAFFAGIEVQYRSSGIAYTRAEILRLDPVSPGLVAVDLRWPLFTADGDVKGGERARYLLQLDGGAPRIRSVVMLGTSTH